MLSLSQRRPLPIAVLATCLSLVVVRLHALQPVTANARESEHLASIGLDALASLRAATLFAARAVGMPRDIGVLAPGRLADVIGVDGNPLQDLRALQRVRFVMKDGNVK